MTSSWRTSRVILSALRGEVCSSALMAGTEVIRENNTTRNRTVRFILPPFRPVLCEKPRSIVAGDLDERGLGASAQHRLGIRGGKLFYLGRNVHRTKLRPAHGTEVGVFEAIPLQRLVMHGSSPLRIEPTLELALQADARAGGTELVIKRARPTPMPPHPLRLIPHPST